MDSGSGADDHRNKRHKVAIACDRCRSKKIKCDGVRPVCAPCSKRKASANLCTWDNGDSRGLHLSLAQVLQLQNRVRELERDRNPQGGGDVSQLRDSLTQVIYDARPTTVPEHSLSQRRIPDHVNRFLVRSPPRPLTSMDQRSQRQVQSIGPSQASHTQATVFKSPASAGGGSLGTSASAMIGSIPDDVRPQSQEFFGGSSAGCFINQVRQAVKRKMHLPESRTSHQSTDPAAQQLRTTVQESRFPSPDLVFPARSKADQLLNVYWDIVYVLYPFVDKSETLHKYQSLFSGHAEYEQDRMFVCLLNVIFALSCQLSGTIEAHRRDSSAKVYYQRARELLDLWSTGSFLSVQVYLLLGQYFQSTNEPHQCWMMIGAAIRTAQSLGLHLSETTEQIASPRRKQLTRTVWHGCVIMDRVVSMTYGRPPMINAALATAVPLPLAIDEDRLPQDGQIPPSTGPSILDFFIQTAELYEILYDVLVGFYSSSTVGEFLLGETWGKYLGRTGVSNTFSSIDLEQRLVGWESQLPSHLKLDDPEKDIRSGKYFARQAVILHQRYLHIRLLSLRPVLSACVAAETSNMEPAKSFGGILSQRVALQCAIMCVTVAQETINLAYNRRPSDPNSVGTIAAWWYNVLFVYSAATVLVAARLCPSVIAETSQESISNSWNRAIELLEQYQSFNPVIEQVVATLHMLYNILPDHYSQAKETRLPAMRFGQSSNTGNSGLTPWVQPDERRDHGSDLGAVQTGDVASMNLSTMLSQESLTYHDFDFSIDTHDLSWLNAMPFEL